MPCLLYTSGENSMEPLCTGKGELAMVDRGVPMPGVTAIRGVALASPISIKGSMPGRGAEKMACCEARWGSVAGSRRGVRRIVTKEECNPTHLQFCLIKHQGKVASATWSELAQHDVFCDTSYFIPLTIHGSLAQSIGVEARLPMHRACGSYIPAAESPRFPRSCTFEGVLCPRG